MAVYIYTDKMAVYICRQNGRIHIQIMETRASILLRGVTTALALYTYTHAYITYIQQP
jgi:hypothetical protein